MKRLRTAVLALCLPLAGGTALAADFSGADPFEFLFLDGGARQAALGGAFAAGNDDANVIGYNPAGLGFMEGHHASFMHNSHFQGVTREHFAAAFAQGVGVSADRVSYGPIRRTTLSSPDGSGLDDFTPSALAFAGGFAMEPAPDWRVGLAGKYIQETLDTVRASAWAVDAGLQVRLDHPAVLLGLAAQNMGPRTSYLSKPEPLPLNIKLGAALHRELLGMPVGLLADVNKAPRGRHFFSAGVSLTPLRGVTGRLGYNTRNQAGPGISIGIGFSLSAYSLDYAMVPFGDLGSSHLLSVGVRWGEWREEPTSEWSRQ